MQKNSHVMSEGTINTEITFSEVSFLQEDMKYFPSHPLMDTSCHLAFSPGYLKAFQVWKPIKPWVNSCNIDFDKNHFNEQISLRYSTYLKSAYVSHKLITQSFHCGKCNWHSWHTSICFCLLLAKTKSPNIRSITLGDIPSCNKITFAKYSLGTESSLLSFYKAMQFFPRFYQPIFLIQSRL